MKAYRHRVQYYETDKMGITHHSNYIRWMEEARVDFLEQIGWGYDKMEELGIVSPVVNVRADYKSPTTFGDEVEVEVRLLEYTGLRLLVGYEMHRVSDGKKVFVGSSSHCFLSPKGSFLRLSRDYPALDSALRGYLGPAESDKS